MDIPRKGILIFHNNNPNDNHNTTNTTTGYTPGPVYSKNAAGTSGPHTANESAPALKYPIGVS